MKRWAASGRSQAGTPSPGWFWRSPRSGCGRRKCLLAIGQTGSDTMLHVQRSYMGRNGVSLWYDIMQKNYFKSCVNKLFWIKCKALWNSATNSKYKQKCGLKELLTSKTQIKVSVQSFLNKRENRIESPLRKTKTSWTTAPTSIKRLCKKNAAVHLKRLKENC
jgi:hypothetical protein